MENPIFPTGIAGDLNAVLHPLRTNLTLRITSPSGLAIAHEKADTKYVLFTLAHAWVLFPQINFFLSTIDLLNSVNGFFH